MTDGRGPKRTTTEALLIWAIQEHRADRHATETGLLPIEAIADGREVLGHSSDSSVSVERY